MKRPQPPHPRGIESARFLAVVQWKENPVKALTVSISSLLALGGCATSSGIALNTQGDQSLTVSASPVKGGAPAAQRLAREEATASCAKDGKRMQIIAEVLYSPSFVDQLVVTGMSRSTLTFRCVATVDRDAEDRAAAKRAVDAATPWLERRLIENAFRIACEEGSAEARASLGCPRGL